MANIRRSWVQACAALLQNLHLSGFVSGRIYQGNGKYLCTPGLNCYSCPGAVSGCPLGALQAALGDMKLRGAAYISGLLLLFSALLGRLTCGWICPFGWIQDLLHRIPGRKVTVPRELRHMRYLRYILLAVFVVLFPLFFMELTGVGQPAFCAYLCPVGTLEAGIPLVLLDQSLRSALGFLYAWKLLILAAILLLSVWVYRPFCRFGCPLGLIYGWFNRIALYRYELDAHTCTRCSSCSKACPVQLNPVQNPNHADCIRCGKCTSACPNQSLHAVFGFHQPTCKTSSEEDSHANRT